MTGIFLLIPDAALREAVAEQIAAARLGEPRLVDSGLAWVKQTETANPCVVLIDDSGQDKKIPALLRALADAPGKPVILMLGGTGDIDGVSESFVKPFRLGHLIARLRYYLETAPLLRNKTVSFGPYRLEPQNRCVASDKGGDVIRLTEKETTLLAYLARRPEPATRRDILAEVWGYDERIDTHTLETHIYQLRRKLDREGGGENWLIFEAGTYRLARGQE